MYYKDKLFEILFLDRKISRNHLSGDTVLLGIIISISFFKLNDF